MTDEVLRNGLIAAVRIHARENYAYGWDLIVECWEDKDILMAVGDARTVAVALVRVQRLVDLYKEREREVQSEVF